MPDKITPEQTDPNGGGTEDPKGEAQASDKKAAITFDPEQTEWVNTLANKMFGKGFEKAKTELGKEWEVKLTDAQRLIEDLNKKVEGLSSEKPKQQPKDEMQALAGQLDALRQQTAALQAERDAAQGELGSYRKATHEARIKSEFLEAARGIQFFDPMEVFMLMRTEIDTDDAGRIVIKNPKTNVPRYNSNAEPLSLAEALVEFAKSKPYMVRMPNADGGTGSGETRKLDAQRLPTLKDVGVMSAEQFEAYKQKLKAGR